ncbi:MAG: CRTAC1 family protein [Planctomycetota bacterium]
MPSHLEFAIRLALVPAMALTLLSACDRGSGEEPAKTTGAHDVDPEAVLPFAAELPPAVAPGKEGAELRFDDVTREAGITFRSRSGTPSKLWIPENIGHGAMFFDYDGDGDEDLYLANGGDLERPGHSDFRNALYRNDGGFRFTDVTEGSGLECPDWSCGVYTVDFDADGWRDVYVTQLGRNRFFRNLEGSGRFEDVTDRLGGDDPRWSTSAAFFDADADGDLDLYVCNYVEFDIRNPPFDGVPCDWRGLRVCCGPRGLPEAADRFYEFRDGRYVDATEERGFTLRDRRGQVRGSYSLGVVTADYDDDGDVDVYVAVDSRPNLLFINDGSGRFTESAQRWLVAVNSNAVEQAGMGVTAADLNGDDRLDLFVTNFSHDTNTLYLAAGDEKNRFFDDATSTAGLGGSASYTFLSWGTGIHDFDLDGRLDILVASGHVYPQADGAKDLGTSYAQMNQLFMGGERALEFKDRARDAGPAFATPHVSRATSFADLDLDGRMDFIITNVDSWPTLAHNLCRPKGSFIGLILAGKNPRNRDAIGATVRLVLEDDGMMRRDQLGGGGYFASNQPLIHFGLDGKKAREIRVRWADGAEASYPAPAPGAYYRLEQASGTLTKVDGR